MASEEWALASSSLAACNSSEATDARYSAGWQQERSHQPAALLKVSPAGRCAYPDAIQGTFNQSLTYESPTIITLPHYYQVHATHTPAGYCVQQRLRCSGSSRML